MIVKKLVASKIELGEWIKFLDVAGLKGTPPKNFPCVCVAVITDKEDKKFAEMFCVYKEDFE